jgi:Flp pilus assembly protein TadG
VTDEAQAPRAAGQRRRHRSVMMPNRVVGPSTGHVYGFRDGALRLRPEGCASAGHAACLPRLWRDERGIISLVTALTLVVVIGFVGLALDVGTWYRSQRALQNAADAAVLAAAVNAGSTYDEEAKAVASSYGFVDGSGGITVTPTNNVTCPDGTSGCYKVVVSQASAPVFFASVLGISGPPISATAMANNGAQDYCILALGTTGATNAIRGDGTPGANMNGCSVMSNTGANCNGHNLGATWGDAAGTNSGCGVNERSNVPKVADPYKSLATNIPTNPCTTYYTESKKSSLPASNQLSGSVTWSSSATQANGQIICGDLQLTGTVTVTSSAGLGGAVLVIENGELDTNGYTLQTAQGSALTVIFSGSSGKYYNYPTDNGGAGTLNFEAPTSGTWKGIALYQDPNLPTSPNTLGFTYTGNSPTWDITGAVYFPNASIQFKGAINKSAYGGSCLLFVVGDILVAGTADIEQTTYASCKAAGVTLPTSNFGVVQLVM